MSIMREFRVLFIIAGLGLLCTGRWSSATPGDLYISQGAGGTILKFSPDGMKSTFISGLDFPGAVAFDRTGNLFVAVGSGQFSDIAKIAPSGEMTVFATGLSLPSGLAFDGAGNLYVTESSGDTGDILKVTPDGAKSQFSSYVDILESGSPVGLGFSPGATFTPPFRPTLSILTAESFATPLMEQEARLHR